MAGPFDFIGNMLGGGGSDGNNPYPNDPLAAEAYKSDSPWANLFGGGTSGASKRQGMERVNELQSQDAMAKASQTIAAAAAEGKHPSQIAKELLTDPNGIIKDLNADQLKSLFADVIPGVAPKPTVRPAGNSLFMEDGDTGQLSLGAEGGHTETGRNPVTGDTINTYRPGMTFGADGKPNASYVYPSSSGQDAKSPNNNWWVANNSAPPELNMLFAAVGAKYGLPPDMLASQSYKESRWNPNLVSPKGAKGISQFMPGTATDFGLDLSNPGTPEAVAASVDAQGKFMKQLVDEHKGDYRKALMAYNWGPQNVRDWITRGSDPAEVPDETTDYVRTITGDTSALPQITYRPGMSFKKALQAYLPEGTKATMADVDKVAMANPALMFLGAGAVPMLAEVGIEVGRQISPEVESEWATANNYSRIKLRRLTADLAVLHVQSGGQRYKGPFDRLMATDPSAGGVINDPKDALASAIDLHDTMTARVDELESYNIDNTPKTLLDDYIKEKNLTLRVLKDLPTRDQMTDMQGYIAKYPEILPSGGNFVQKAVDFLNQGTNSVKRQTKQATQAPEQAPQPQPQAGPAPNPTAAPSMPASFKEGMTATNPNTGEKVIFKGGKWVPYGQ